MFHSPRLTRAAATAAMTGTAAALAAGAVSTPAQAKTTHAKPARHAATAGRSATQQAQAAALEQLIHGSASASPTTAAGALSSLSGMLSAMTDPSPMDAQSASADFANGPMSVDYSAQKPAGEGPTSATGTFTAQIADGSTTLAQLKGPVTCLNVQGSQVGLFYPVKSSTPAGVNTVMKGVYVSVLMGPGGRPMSFSFRPSLTPTADGPTNCAPMPTFIPIMSGTGSVSG